MIGLICRGCDTVHHLKRSLEQSVGKFDCYVCGNSTVVLKCPHCVKMVTFIPVSEHDGVATVFCSRCEADISLPTSLWNKNKK